ncbi:MAG: EamA family transporter [[Clostridium] scindens]
MLQNFALSWSPPSLVSMVQCSQPVLTAIISFLLLGERLGTLGLIGAFIILACTLAESIKSRNESRD